MLIYHKESIEQVEQYVRKALIIIGIALFILFTDIFGSFANENIAFVAFFFSFDGRNTNDK